ncbi:MAG TPA: phosphoribosyltransferase family protein [Patescibacteria group bacterium]|nr:phosphoribosyltransferase family protein [Patescibacteria group bacterium]
MENKYFANRAEAGTLLAHLLRQYQNPQTVIYALPRGGVVTASEVALSFRAPLELLLTRKIAQRDDPELALAAISEEGYFVSDSLTIERIEPWTQHEIERQRKEIIRRRHIYTPGYTRMQATGKTAIIIDDGAATGLTLRAGVLELRAEHPARLIVALPVLPASTAERLSSEVDDVVALLEPLDREFLGSVGAYYADFHDVSDAEVKALIAICAGRKDWSSTRPI